MKGWDLLRQGGWCHGPSYCWNLSRWARGASLVGRRLVVGGGVVGGVIFGNGIVGRECFRFFVVRVVAVWVVDLPVTTFTVCLRKIRHGRVEGGQEPYCFP